MVRVSCMCVCVCVCERERERERERENNLLLTFHSEDESFAEGLLDCKYCAVFTSNFFLERATGCHIFISLPL